MTVYTNFIGIDIGKFSFVVSCYGNKTTAEYENSPLGIAEFVETNIDILSNSLCIVETTGGYELELIYSLLSYGYKVHRADTRKVKNFIRSFGCAAKTDVLDAKALAVYGYERGGQLSLFEAKNADTIALFQLVQRRKDLKANLVAEKNRLKSPSSNLIKDSIASMINVLTEQLELITNKIKLLVSGNEGLKRRCDILKTIPGIGEIIAFELVILLPELGSLCRRKIASLAGVAPLANDSGKFSGYRRTGYGRGVIPNPIFNHYFFAPR